jgi:hypothetical protein
MSECESIMKLLLSAAIVTCMGICFIVLLYGLAGCREDFDPASTQSYQDCLTGVAGTAAGTLGSYTPGDTTEKRRSGRQLVDEISERIRRFPKTARDVAGDLTESFWLWTHKARSWAARTLPRFK